MTPRQMLLSLGSAKWHHRYRYTKPAPWRPITDEEWEEIRPLIVDPSAPGRPIPDPRQRFDACLFAATMPGAWDTLPERFGKPDTISRTFRRWAHRGVWDNLLIWASSGRHFTAQLEYLICRAFRRAWRVLGLNALRLARRTGLLTALRAPPHWLPDPDMSEYLHQYHFGPAYMNAPREWLPSRGQVWVWKILYTVCLGRSRIPKGSAPP